MEMNKKTVVLLLVVLVMAQSGCSSNTESGESDSSLGVTPIATKENVVVSSLETGESSANYVSNAIPEGLFSDNFVILDNNIEAANIYEIDVTTPFHRTVEWAANNAEQMYAPTFVTDNWIDDSNLCFVLQWFMGSGFTCYSQESAEAESTGESSLIRYDPPSGTMKNMTETVHTIPINSIPDWEEIPITCMDGTIDPTAQVACIELDGNVFPREACYAPGEPPYFPDECDTLHCFGLSDHYINGIPLMGTLNILGVPSGIFEYHEMVGPTYGFCSNLFTKRGGARRNHDYVVFTLQSMDFSIKSTVQKDLPIKPVLECVDGICDALDYLPYYSAGNVEIYIAELAYLPLSELDINTLDFPEDAKTYLVPVWNLYFRYGENAGFCCATIDAISGESLYSKEYGFNDPRLEQPDPEG